MNFAEGTRKRPKKDKALSSFFGFIPSQKNAVKLKRVPRNGNVLKPFLGHATLAK